MIMLHSRNTLHIPVFKKYYFLRERSSDIASFLEHPAQNILKLEMRILIADFIYV